MPKDGCNFVFLCAGGNTSKYPTVSVIGTNRVIGTGSSAPGAFAMGPPGGIRSSAPDAFAMDQEAPGHRHPVPLTWAPDARHRVIGIGSLAPGAFAMGPLGGTRSSAPGAFAIDQATPGHRHPVPLPWAPGAQHRVIGTGSSAPVAFAMGPPDSTGSSAPGAFDMD